MSSLTVQVRGQIVTLLYMCDEFMADIPRFFINRYDKTYTICLIYEYSVQPPFMFGRYYIQAFVTIFSNNYGYSFTKAVTQTLESVAQIMS